MSNETPPTAAPQTTPARFVGIGASAGGLQALEELFDNLEPDTGMAFFVIQHLSPDFDSLMDQLIARHTEMRVELISDAVEVEANCIYLLPPGKEAILSGNQILLTERSKRDGGLNFPIDEFFRSLGQNAGENAVGVILSGTGTDGSRGIRDIYTAGGLVMAQSVESAAFDGMPRAACDTGTTSLILSPTEIARTLNRLFLQEETLETGSKGMEPADRMEPSMRLIFNLLHNSYGLDFSFYKAEMIIRRIERRAKLSKSANVDEYIQLLENDRDEVDLLYHDMLIGVTDFFRDHQVFERLQLDVLPGLIDQLGPDEEFRCWIAGTATGEEAYSMAMLIAEEFAKRDIDKRVRIFASDVHETSLQLAGKGIYVDDQMLGVTPERRDKFFIHRQDGWYIAPELRKMVVFTPHNVIHDAPFTRLDLICCRNVLIYFTPHTQQRVLSLFHFGLKTGGVLCLGHSETLGDLREEFQAVDEPSRIFRKHRELNPGKRPGMVRRARWMPAPNHTLLREKSQKRHLLKTYDELLRRFEVPAILVNENREILHVLGGAGRFLQVNDGRPTTDILQAVHPELRSACSIGLIHVRRQSQPVEVDDVACTLDGESLNVTVTAESFSVEEEVAVLLRFACSSGKEKGQPALKLSGREVDTIEQLERELHFTQDNLQSTIEELQSTNEELQSTNEQLTASNEELQSTNEELHSVNEELYTVNAEHQRKIDELTELNDDIDNLLTTTNVHTLFLDADLRLRRFTPHIAELFNLIPQDIGRPISAFTHKLVDIELPQLVGGVIKTEKPIQREVKDHMQQWYLLRIFPYLARGAVDGAVVTLVNVTTLQTATEALQKSEERFNLAVSGSNAGIWDWKDVRQEAIWCSSRMYALLGRSPDQEMTISLWQELIHPEDHDGFVAALYDHLKHNVPFDVEFRMEQANSKDYHWYHMRGAAERDVQQIAIRMAGSFEDVSVRRAAEQEVQKGVRRRDQFLAMLSHELRNPLGAVTNAVAVLSNDRVDSQQKSSAINVVQRQLRQVSRLLDDLLDVSRITHGKFELRRSTVDLCNIAEQAIAVVQSSLEESDLGLSVEMSAEPVVVTGDPARLQQVVVNLLTNAIKYTDPQGDIHLSLTADDDQTTLIVKDTGAGIPQDKIAEIFQLFYQSDETLDRSDGGMGVGLTLVKAVIDLHGGRVSADSDGPGTGSTFTVRLPLVKDHSVTQISPDENELPLRIQSVVLVEDLDDARDMLASLLTLEGLTVHEAATGTAGLAMIKEVMPDAAIIDIGLPEMDGHTIARTIRENPDFDRIRLVALTGYGQDSDRIAVKDSGFDLHLVKPLNPEKLQEVLIGISDLPDHSRSL